MLIELSKGKLNKLNTRGKRQAECNSSCLCSICSTKLGIVIGISQAIGVIIYMGIVIAGISIEYNVLFLT